MSKTRKNFNKRFKNKKKTKKVGGSDFDNETLIKNLEKQNADGSLSEIIKNLKKQNLNEKLQKQDQKILEKQPDSENDNKLSDEDNNNLRKIIKNQEKLKKKIEEKKPGETYYGNKITEVASKGTEGAVNLAAEGAIKTGRAARVAAKATGKAAATAATTTAAVLAAPVVLAAEGTKKAARATAKETKQAAREVTLAAKQARVNLNTLKAKLRNPNSNKTRKVTQRKATPRKVIPRKAVNIWPKNNKINIWRDKIKTTLENYIDPKNKNNLDILLKTLENNLSNLKKFFSKNNININFEKNEFNNINDWYSAQIKLLENLQSEISKQVSDEDVISEGNILINEVKNILINLIDFLNKEKSEREPEPEPEPESEVTAD